VETVTDSDRPQRLCDITCSEDCRRCEDPTDHRYGWCNLSEALQPQWSRSSTPRSEWSDPMIADRFRDLDKQHNC
jgi:hypothetical protein